MRDFTEILGPNREFHTTSWSLVRAASEERALDAIVSIYWKPLYFFVRQQGHDNETAKDIVQEFLTALIGRGAIEKADPARGRFRTFLLTALANFMKDRNKGALRDKRGGGRKILSLDFAAGESAFRIEVGRGEPPEKALNRAWARGVWDRSLSELQAEPAHMEAFKLYLEDADYRTICARTGLSVPAAKTAIHRLKRRLREIVVGHLRAGLSDEGELPAEIDEFMELLRAPEPPPSREPSLRPE